MIDLKYMPLYKTETLPKTREYCRRSQRFELRQFTMGRDSEDIVVM